MAISIAMPMFYRIPTENFLAMNRAAAQNVIDHFNGTLDPRCYVR